MSNLIPPLVSSSPPPMVADEPDDLDDEFGDFTAATDLSFEGYSLPTTPQHASYSNFTSNSFQTQSNLIISPKMKNHLEANKVSENMNIFCDIKDINTTFVNNNKSEEIQHDIKSESVIKQDVQRNIDVLESVPRINVRKTENKNDDDFGDYSCFSSEDRLCINVETDSKENENNLNELNEVINNDSISETQGNNVPNNELSVISEESKVLENITAAVNNCEHSLPIESTENVLTNSTDCFKKEIECLEKCNSVFSISDESQVNSCESDDNVDFEVSELHQNKQNSKIIENEQTYINSTELNINHQIVEEIKQNTEEINEETKTVDEFGDFNSTLTQEIINKKCNIKSKSKDDSFGDFCSPVSQNGINGIENTTDDEFGDFSFSLNLKTEETAIVNSTEKQSDFNSYLNTGSIDNKCIHTEIKNSSVDFENFSLIEESKSVENSVEVEETINIDESNTCSKTIQIETEDEFGDFNFISKNEETKDKTTQELEQDFQAFHFMSTQTIEDKSQQIAACLNDEDLDDFGDFNDYTAEDVPTNLDLSVANSSTNAEKIINDVFNDNESELVDIVIMNFMENSIFKQVQDIENTNALGYQWANSDSQKTLLKALNIDSRNILYGPRWNVAMPRFAANLGFTPLEPMKTELPASGPIAIAPTVQPEQPFEVPAAKFDWTSSGLVNPLDSQSTETVKPDPVEDKINQTEIRRQSGENNASHHLDVNILNNFGSDNESVNSLKFIESVTETETEIRLEVEPALDKTSTVKKEFSSFQSSKPEHEHIWNGLVPQKIHIKESHISNCEPEIINKNHVLNIELETTIVTPELPRKNVNSKEPEDDEFADFQMSLPQDVTSKNVSAIVSLEPLKPIVLETSVINNISTQINWPEPGIINEDLNHFDFSYVNQNSETDIPVKKETSEEDDWSDFVSAQQTSKQVEPITSKPKQSGFSNVFSQNNSQLELSIPNLQNTHVFNKPTFIPNSSPTKTVSQQMGHNYQPPYQIPLQTINTPFGGLPQTSLSTYNNFTIGPIELPTQSLQSKKNNSSDFGIFDGPFNSEVKPFQSYNPASQVNNPIQPEFQMNYQVQSVESTFLKMQQPSKEILNTKQDDDDDWTDFVSSQPAGQNLNGFGQSKQSNNFNIIANPVHFEAFQSFQSSSNNRNGKNCVPSISALPELDFIAPKSKFSKK